MKIKKVKWPHTKRHFCTFPCTRKNERPFSIRRRSGIFGKSHSFNASLYRKRDALDFLIFELPLLHNVLNNTSGTNKYLFCLLSSTICDDDKKHPVVGISLKIELCDEKYRLPLTVACSDSFRSIKCSQSIFEIRASD